MRCRWLLILAAALFAACGTEYFDPEISGVDVPTDSRLLPQAGTLMQVHYAYKPATKFQPDQDFRYFRYRAKIDGMSYAYGVVRDDAGELLSIPLPANDSYATRGVVIEAAEAGSYGREDWGAWAPVYRGVQDCLPAGAALRYAGLAEKRLLVTIGSMQAVFLFCDSASAVELKRLLSEGPLSFEVDVYQDYIASVLEDPVGQTLLRRIPQNLDDGKERMKGDLFLSGYGQLEFYNKPETDWSEKTRLATVEVESQIDFAAMCIGVDRQRMTLTLID